jgi:hypothetical protein
MTLPDVHARSYNLPVTHRLRLVTAASLGIALLMTSAPFATSACAAATFTAM